MVRHTLAFIYVIFSSLLPVNLAKGRHNGGSSHHGHYDHHRGFHRRSEHYHHLPWQDYYPGYYPWNGPQIYSNTAATSYEGLDEANALKSEYPKQPIIIINNKVEGNEGRHDCDCNCRSEFIDFLKLLLDARSGRYDRKYEHSKESNKIRSTAATPSPHSPSTVSSPTAVPIVAAPSTAVSVNSHNSGSKSNSNNNCRINITVVLPSLSNAVSVGEKKLESNAKNKGSKDEKRPVEDGDT